MALLITEQDVRALLSEPMAMAEAIDAMELVFRAQARGELALHPRVHVDYPPGSATERSGRALRLLPAIVPELGAAVRLYTMNKSGDPFRPAPCELLLLFDFESMKLTSVIEDYSLHTIRTAAPTGVATRCLARSAASRVGLVGTGRQARGQLAAVASVRQLRDVRVYGRDEVRRHAFCEEVAGVLDCPVTACRRPEDAVQGADVVITATNPISPVLRYEWLAPGAHVNSIASGELDDETAMRARVFPSYSAEVIRGHPPWEPFARLIASGALSEEDIGHEFCDVVSGRVPGRQRADEITVFISTGMATWDVAIAAWVTASAARHGVGGTLWDPERGRTHEGLVSPRPSPPPLGSEPR